VLLWVLLLVPVLACALAQQRVRGTFERYAAIADRSGMTGAQVARRLLDSHGLRHVRIERAPQTLADHYDGDARVLRLSAEVAQRASVAAVAIAAHEVAHAYQDADGSRAYRRRVRIGTPLARIAPSAGFVVVAALWLGSLPLLVLAAAYMAGLVLFALATLPVELEASRDALRLLGASGLATSEESREVRAVLRAAALTYVAGTAQQVALFLLLLAFAGAAFAGRPG
jgi:Zn-dependent membrane protease YugP